MSARTSNGSSKCRESDWLLRRYTQFSVELSLKKLARPENDGHFGNFEIF